MEDHLLCQAIDKPTRGGAILDVLLTNNDRSIGSVKSTNTFLSDHNLVEILLKFNPAKGIKLRDVKKWDPHSFRGRKLESADYDAMKDDFAKVNWDELLSQCEDENDGDNDGSHFVNLVRQLVLDTCIANSEPKVDAPGKRESRNKRLIIRQKKKLKARYLALKAKNPLSDKVQKLENQLFLLHVKIREVIFSELTGQ